MSVTDNGLIYARYAQSGVPVNQYFSIENIASADAAGILKSIEDSFERNGFPAWKDKITGFGSDGASVNLGCRSGIAKLIKDDVPHLIITHYGGHRLEIASNNAIKHHSHARDTRYPSTYL